MKLRLKDNDGFNIELGDTVEVIKLTDNSAMASELYGVEPQLDGWVEEIYLEEFIGEVSFNEEKLMYVIKSKRTEIPLSKHIRYNLYKHAIDERVSEEDLKQIRSDFKLINCSCEAIVDYILIKKRKDNPFLKNIPLSTNLSIKLNAFLLRKMDMCFRECKVHDLSKLDLNEFRKFYGVGIKKVKELERICSKYGVNLK